MTSYLVALISFQPTLRDESLSSIEFHDSKRASLIIKVIGRMCDGQYRPMQDYLRDQTDSIHSVNIVEEIVIFIQEFSKWHFITMSSDTISLLDKCFQALIELCSGNYYNSKLVLKKQIVSLINNYLLFDITYIQKEDNIIDDEDVEEDSDDADEDSNEDSDYVNEENGDVNESNDDVNDHVEEVEKARVKVLKLKASVVSLLEVMLERVDDRTEQLAKQITDVLDIRALQYTMLDFFALKDDKHVKKSKADDNAIRALFKTYSVILTLKGTVDGSKS